MAFTACNGESTAERGGNECVKALYIAPSAEQKAVIVPAPDFEKFLGLPGGSVQLHALLKWDDFVIAAVNNQHRTAGQLREFGGREPDARKPPHRKPSVDPGSHVGNGYESALQDQRPWLVPARHTRRDCSPQRPAEHDDLVGRDSQLLGQMAPDRLCIAVDPASEISPSLSP